MASKKLKKAIMAGIAGYAGSKMLGQKKQMAEYLKTEGGDKAKVNYITKKPTQKFSFSKEKFKKAVNTIKDKGLDLGPGVNATSKKGGTLAGDYGDAFDYFNMSKGGATKVVKARGGKMVNLKPTKLY